MVSVVLALLLAAHPIHTTVLELAWDARTGALTGTLRVFEDDLSAASAAAGLDAADYARGRLGISADGKAVALAPCGARRVADAVLLCVRGSIAPVKGLRVRNTVLMERYSDQVNIVRLDGRAPRTLLLTLSAPEQAVHHN